MEYSELIRARYSVRGFKDTPIEQEKLDAILEAGRVAPTATNAQPQRIYVARSAETIEKIKALCPCTYNAPVILVICYDEERVWKNKLMPGYNSGDVDAAIVTTHMMLEAWQQGIGSCWVGWFNAEQLGEALGLPKTSHVAALLPIGYADAAAGPQHSSFRDFDDTIQYI